MTHDRPKKRRSCRHCKRERGERPRQVSSRKRRGREEGKDHSLERVRRRTSKPERWDRRIRTSRVTTWWHRGSSSGLVGLPRIVRFVERVGSVSSVPVRLLGGSLGSLDGSIDSEEDPVTSASCTLHGVGREANHSRSFRGRDSF